MMNRDEMGTLRRVQALQKDIVAPLVVASRGRVFKLIGDGALADFRSIHDAFAAATGILEALGDSELDLKVRIGLHIGDLIFEGDDVFGEGVNIAARLEGVARPGSVAISERALSELDKTHTGFEDLGRINLKNIKEPVRVFLFDRRESPRILGIAKAWRKARMPLFSLLLAILLSVGGFVFWQRYSRSPERVANEVAQGQACSWLGVKRFAVVNGITFFELEGGSIQDEAELGGLISAEITRKIRQKVWVDTRQVGSLPPSFCGFVQRFSKLRYNGPSRITMDGVYKRESKVFQESLTSDVKKTPDLINSFKKMRNYVRFTAASEHFRSYAEAYRISQLGKIYKVGRLTDNSTFGFYTLYNSGTPSAFLIIDSEKPIPSQLVTGANFDLNSLDALERAAEDGKWNIELLWYTL